MPLIGREHPQVLDSADERACQLRRKTRCDSGIDDRLEAGRSIPLSHQAGDVPTWPRCRTKNRAESSILIPASSIFPIQIGDFFSYDW
jgi:hypothetical protein